MCTGPRQESGFPSWPFPSLRAWTLFQDDVKVVIHGVGGEGRLGAGADVQHALHTEGKMSHVAAQIVLKGLQLQGDSEVDFRRHIQPNTTNRRKSSVV